MFLGCQAGKCFSSPLKTSHNSGLCAHLAVRPAVGDLQPVHGIDHGLHGDEDVLVDERPEGPAVVLRVAGAMDDAHLLDECALPALTGSWGQTACSEVGAEAAHDIHGAHSAYRAHGTHIASTVPMETMWCPH